MTRLTILMTFAALMPFAAFAEGTPGEHFITNWDLNEDGAVTVEEATERREMVFAKFDTDENGMLDAGEYALFDETRAAHMKNAAGGHGKNRHRMHEGMTLAFNDTDADGAVSKAEFLAGAGPWIAQLDRDGDGAVTSADFGPRAN